ncbi:MAG: condensation domain-containing protein, partial [Candidatus Thiodiazotropha sp.]
MTSNELLSLLNTKGVAVSIKGENLAVSGDERVLTDEALLSLLKKNKAALINLIKAGEVGANAGATFVPPRSIREGVDAITPEMLPLVRLSQEAIDRIVATIEGGARNVQEIYPLGPLQEGILFHSLAAQDRDPYLLRAHLGFDGRSRLEGFLRALQQVIDRHEVLRTSFAWEELEEPVQVVWRRAKLPVEFVETEADVRRLDIRCAPLLHCQ